MKSHGKSKAVIAAVIFEVNLLQSSRFGEALDRYQDGDFNKTKVFTGIKNK